MTKLTDIIIRSLTTKVSPMVYIMMFISVIIGFCFSTGFLVGGGESILYSAGALIPVAIWGGVLFVSAITCLVGFYTKLWGLVNTGSLFAWMMWLFACINLLIEGHVYALITFGLFHLAFMGYVFLSSGLGVLERHSDVTFQDRA